MDYKTFTTNFLDRIRQKCNATDLGTAAQRLIESQSGQRGAIDLPDESVPNLIRDLSPPISPLVTVFPKSHVRIDWGGGWGHWGLIVGNQSFSPTNDALYFLEWSPGIFAYHTRR